MGAQSPLGLALGGGGVRGGAHIGLLKVLDRERIPVGAIAGTSAGGIVGGLYAAGLSGAEIETFLTSFAPLAILEPDYSGWSLLSTHRFIDALRERVGDIQIEDLRHPFAAVAVDLRNSQEVILTHGPLATAIQATMAVPGLLCPVERDGGLLVDGGVLNNVPVDAVRGLGARRVLAVDVGVPFDFPLEVPSFGVLPGPVPRLLERMVVLTGRQRAALALMKSFDLLSAQNTARRLRDDPPDLLLRPDLGAIPVADIKRLPETIAIGERLAEQRLAEIRRLCEEHPGADRSPLPEGPHSTSS